jgi:membrane-bound lytic murein transglycosylase B
MKKSGITFLLIGLLFLIKPAFGITNSEVELCFSNAKLDSYCQREGDDACQEILEKCDDYLTGIQKEYEKDIEKTEQEKENLANQISRLENRMSQLEAEIQQSEMRIRNLGYEINDTQQSIVNMNKKIDKSRGQLSEMLRTIKRENKKSVLEILMVEDDLSDFFNNLATLEVLSRESNLILDQVKSLRNSLETEEQRLARQKEEVEEEVQVQVVQKRQNSELQSQYEYSLSLTQQEIQDKKQQKQLIDEKVQEILSRRLSLFGVSEEEAPSLEEAIEIVKWVEQKTNVRAGFVLSIIMQESALGRNVGQCYLTDKVSGNSRNIRTSQLYVRGLKASRDLSPFLKIASRFGRNPLETPVSCYIPMCYSLSTGHVTTNVSMNRNGYPNCPSGYSIYGFGGAIGPAQFLPSTWERNVLVSILNREPNPWNVRDAFLGSANYLKQMGAANNELNAAARYYGTSGIGYESAVMQRSYCLQTYINQKTMSTGCQAYLTPFLD